MAGRGNDVGNTVGSAMLGDRAPQRPQQLTEANLRVSATTLPMRCVPRAPGASSSGQRGQTSRAAELPSANPAMHWRPWPRLRRRPLRATIDATAMRTGSRASYVSVPPPGHRHTATRHGCSGLRPHHDWSSSRGRGAPPSSLAPTGNGRSGRPSRRAGQPGPPGRPLGRVEKVQHRLGQLKLGYTQRMVSRRMS